MTNLSITAAAMSPYLRGNVEALLAGDDSTDTLHSARREVAAFADRLVGRSRSVRHSPARAAMIQAARAAYDEVAASLAVRDAL